MSNVDASNATTTVQPGEPAPSTDDRVAALESRLDAVAALAEKANATATEVAAAAKPQR